MIKNTHRYCFRTFSEVVAEKSVAVDLMLDATDDQELRPRAQLVIDFLNSCLSSDPQFMVKVAGLKPPDFYAGVDFMDEWNPTRPLHKHPDLPESWPTPLPTSQQIQDAVDHLEGAAFAYGDEGQEHHKETMDQAKKDLLALLLPRFAGRQ